jgi:hypothetical protein
MMHLDKCGNEEALTFMVKELAVIYFIEPIKLVEILD